MNEEPTSGLDWETLRGHYHAKRMLEVAASGNHSILLVGPPKAGMTALARSLTTILPAGPFIAPGPHTDSFSAAVEQARGGLLFLQDLDRWDDPALALLRETVARYPGQFLLVATAGYCPCGNYSDAVPDCTCFTVAVEAHQERLRETVYACFAIEAQIPSVNPDLANRRPDEPSRAVRERVAAVRLIQRQRNGEARLNSALSLPEVEGCSPLDMPAQKLLAAAHAQLSPTPRQGLFLLQVARTVADLASGFSTVPCVQANHLAEAIQYRPRWTKGTK